MKTKRLRKSEIRELNNQIERYSFSMNKKDDVEIIENEKIKVVSVNGDIKLFYNENVLLPTMKLLLEDDKVIIPKVIVDMGAVKFVVGGADIMRPGIVDCEEFSSGDAVAIIDQNNKKPLAIGIAMFDSSELILMDSGKVVKNIHYVSDLIWNFG